ncbi:hypothetical protein IFR05_015060 [Cadophora sp. M221]|nr:hypothetical protein IFR05_015060 [Cadophora sp. M221]
MTTPPRPPGAPNVPPTPQPGQPTHSFFTLREASARNQLAIQAQNRRPSHQHRRGFSQGSGSGYSHGRGPANLPQISISFSAEVSLGVETRSSSNPGSSASTPTRIGPSVGAGSGGGTLYMNENEVQSGNLPLSFACGRQIVGPTPAPGTGYGSGSGGPAGTGFYTPAAIPPGGSPHSPNMGSGSGAGMGVGVGRGRGFTTPQPGPGLGLGIGLGPRPGVGFTPQQAGPRPAMGSGIGMGVGVGRGRGFTPLHAGPGPRPVMGTQFTPSAPPAISGSVTVHLPSRFFQNNTGPHARVRGTGPPRPSFAQSQGPRSFTAQTVSPSRPANLPSFIAQQASSPLGPESPSTSTYLAAPTPTIAITPSYSAGLAPPGEGEGAPTTTHKHGADLATLAFADATRMLTMEASSSMSDNELPTLSISVALYSPMGSFLPPLQPLILTSNTHLRGLVLTLQDQLLSNLRLSGSLAKLLVQSIQVRVFNSDIDGFDRFPRIEGLLSGEAEGLGEGGGMGKMVVGKTKWVAWDATGGDGEAEKFWNTLVRKLLLDVMKGGDRDGGKAPMLKVRTVVKVGEIVEGEEVMGERIAGGGHIFRVPADAVLPSPNVVASIIITPRGSIAVQGGKEPESQVEGTSKSNKATAISDPSAEEVNLRVPGSPVPSTTSASGSVPSSQSKLKRKQKKHKGKQQSVDNTAPSASVSDDKIEAAEQILKGLGLSNAAKQISDELKKIKNKIGIEPATATAAATAGTGVGKKSEKGHYERIMGSENPEQVWVEKGGYPKDAPFDPDNNWEKYQTWGEKPTDPGYADRKAVYEAFPLRHIPFNGPVCKPWCKKKSGENGEDSDDEEDEEHEEKGDSLIQMVPYAVLDPEAIKELILEEQNKPENLPPHIKQYWEDQERIKGMSEIDDDIFFPASNPDVIKKEEATKVFAAKEFKNPGRPKFDIRSVLSGPTERRASNNSAYLNSLVADGPSNFYQQMTATGGFQFGQSTTFNHSHAAADNTFQSNLQNFSSFSVLAKHSFKPVSPGPGFYELSKGVSAHTPVKDADSFISDLNGPEQQIFSGVNKRYPVPGTSFNQFSPMANDYAGHQATGTYEEFNAMAAGQDQATGYNVMDGNMMGNNMMSGGNNMASSSFDSFGSMAAGGPSDFRGIVSHGIHQPAGFPNQQGWTSMNTAGATYNTFGGQSNPFNPRTTANTAHNRAMGSFPQFGQSGLPTPTPVARMQSRFFNPMDSVQATPGNERFAFNNMAIPSNPSHPAVGSFVSPMATPANAHPAAGSFVHGGGPSRSRTHGLHVGSNPPASSRIRRPIPIMNPGSSLTASAPAFQLPSPTRQAINYGAGPTAAPLGTGTSGNVPAEFRRTPSPEKKAFQKASMEVLSAAIASAFNGPKGSPSGGNNA